VTIPQRLRKKYHIDSNAEVEFIEEDGRIMLRARRRSEAPIRKLLGRGDVRLSTQEILRLTRGE
jgi:bifunctional DNA-binding transcriptional regulator/antitoxin component of YhaV-PrlF toxin-antitoxin module